MTSVKAMKRSLIIFGGIIILLVSTFFAYDLIKGYIFPCNTIFEQTEAQLGAKLKLVATEGEVFIGKEKVQELTEAAQVTALNLKTCCIVLNAGKVDSNQFLSCKDSAKSYEAQVDTIMVQLKEAEIAKQGGQSEAVKEKVGQINTTVDKAGAISKALTMEIKRIQNGNSRGRMDESEATGGEMGRPEGRKTIQSIKSNVDPALIVHLHEVKRRGEVLNVTVTLTMIGNKEESESFIIYDFESHVMDYDAAKMYGHVKLDGFTSGRLKQGDVKTFHATFRSPPKDTKMVGITFSGLGTFDDVELK